MILKLKECETKNSHSEKISTHFEAAFLKSSIWNGKAPQTKPVPTIIIIICWWLDNNSTFVVDFNVVKGIRLELQGVPNLRKNH